MGVSSWLPNDKRSAKHILEHILAQVVEFKKSSQVCKTTPQLGSDELDCDHAL